MEIVVFTLRPMLRGKLLEAIDSTLKYHSAQLAFLNPECPETQEELSCLIRDETLYLIIADVETNSQLLEICRSIQKKSANIKFLVIGQTDAICIRAVQIHLNLWDYFDENELCLEAKIAESILQLLSDVCRGCMGIFAREGMDYAFIPFERIYYIETIKHTHTCVVYHCGGEANLRESISSLQNDLDARFALCRSSTIANFSKVRRVDYANCCLYFTDTIRCGFSADSKALVKRFIRNHGEKSICYFKV